MIYTNLKVFVAWSFLGSYSPSPLKQNVSIKKFGQINALVFHHFLDIMINLRETTSRFKLQKSPLWQSSVTRLWTFNRGQTQWTLGGFCKRWCWSRDRSGDWLLAPILALSLMGLELYRFEIRNLVTESSKNGSEELKYICWWWVINCGTCPVFPYKIVVRNSQNILRKCQFCNHYIRLKTWKRCQ